MKETRANSDIVALTMADMDASFSAFVTDGALIHGFSMSSINKPPYIVEFPDRCNVTRAGVAPMIPASSSLAALEAAVQESLDILTGMPGFDSMDNIDVSFSVVPKITTRECLASTYISWTGYLTKAFTAISRVNAKPSRRL